MVKHKEKRVTGETAIIGKNLSRLRRSFGLSQRDVADVIETSFQQVQKYEKGQNRIPAERLHRLKQYFDVPYAVFFEGLSSVKSTDYQELQQMSTLLCTRLSRIQNAQFRHRLFRAFMILASE